MTKTFFHRFLLSAFCLLTGLYACNDATVIGTEFIDDEEYLYVEEDTFALRLHTLNIDTLKTNSADRSFLLGALNDSIFGKATAGFYTQLMLSADDISFGVNPQLDSVVLTFNYSNLLYGDPTASTSINVYELTEPMSSEVNYPLSQTFAVNETPIGTKADFVHNLTAGVPIKQYIDEIDGVDSIAIVEAEPHLRIRLNDDFGQKILDQNGTANLQIANFNDFFKGIYVEADPESEVMVALNVYDPLNRRPYSARSRLSLYYRNDSTRGEVLHLRVNDTTAIAANYNVDYSNSAVGQALQNPYPNSQEYFYVQSVGALGVTLDIPNLGKLGKEEVIINKVELEMTLLEKYNERYSNATYPPNIILRTQENGSDVLDNRHFYLSASTDSILREGENLKLLYRFNYTGSSYIESINSYFQGRLDGLLTDGTTFDNQNSLLFPHPLSDTGYRGVFGGPDHPDHPMTLRILYTPVTD